MQGVIVTSTGRQEIEPEDSIPPTRSHSSSQIRKCREASCFNLYKTGLELTVDNEVDCGVDCTVRYTALRSRAESEVDYTES